MPNIGDDPNIVVQNADVLTDNAKLLTHGAFLHLAAYLWTVSVFSRLRSHAGTQKKKVGAENCPRVLQLESF